MPSKTCNTCGHWGEKTDLWTLYAICNEGSELTYKHEKCGKWEACGEKIREVDN